MWYCYLILSEENITYIGVTNDLDHRLKAHNKLIKGGAKATRKGTNWRYIKTKGFNNKSDAYSFEWYWKHAQTKNGKWKRTCGIQNRLARFEELSLY